MKREAEDELLNFCRRQRNHFDAAAWLGAEPHQRERLALVARLLAGTRWYGHRDSLHEIAIELDPRGADEVAFRVQALNFDCARFVNHMRAKLVHAAELDPDVH